MGNLLALDVGSKRTGIAFCSDQTGVAVSLETIKHNSIEALAESVLAIYHDRNISTLLCGLPLLPTGEEGAQVVFVRGFAALLENEGVVVEFVDERYTSDAPASVDKDASAACKLILTYQERNS